MVTVIPASPAHLDEAAALLGATFRGDAVMSRFFVAPASERQRRLTALFELFLRTGMRDGIVDLARDDETGAILGVAIWSRPGRAATGVLQVLADLPLLVRAFGWRGLNHAAKLEKKMDRARPAEPHWYLAAIGTHPDGRGRGVGSALLAHRLATIDRVDAPAYLEASTPRSAALYARFGFVATGTDTAFPEGMQPVSMWRAAAADRALMAQA